jgi:hypothetical protein
MKNHAALRHPFSSASRSCSAASRLSPLAVALPHTSPTEPTQLHVISPCRVPARSAVRVRPVRRSAHRTPTATRRTPGTGLAAPPVPPAPRRTRRWALSVTVSLTALSRSRGRDTRRCICVSPLASRAAAPAPYFTAYRRGACKSVCIFECSVYRIRSTALAWRRAGG